MSRYCVQINWTEVPHLSAAVQAELLASIPPFQKDARSKGIPQLGAGVIYPIKTDDVEVPPFTIPAAWPRAYGFDVGWNWTAAAWGAWDEQNDIIYVYDCYKRGEAEPVVHAEAIRGRGSWMKGVNDPAAAAKNQKDGTKLFEIYKGLGLNIEKADNAITAGLLECWNRFASGRLKVFSTLSPLLAEFSLYHRNERGEIVKANDHLMDAMRYLVMSGKARAQSKPVDAPVVLEEYEYNVGPGSGHGHGWMST